MAFSPQESLDATRAHNPEEEMAPRLATAALSLLASSVLAAAQTPLPKMSVFRQSLDGTPSDIEGPRDLTTSPDTFLDRVWQAGGRSRSQVRVSDRERLILEEDLGYDYDTELKDLAVDFDPTSFLNDRLFTLTVRKVQQLEGGAVQVLPAKITVDDISDPASPSTVGTVLTFADHENPELICTSPDQNKLVVLLQTLDSVTFVPTGYELRIYDYSSGFVLDTVTPPAVAAWPTGMTSCGNTFGRPRRARVAKIQAPGGGEATVVLVLALVSSTGCGNPFKPQPTGLLIADIENPASPFFWGTEMGGDLTKQAWDPCRTDGGCAEWSTNGLAHVRTNEATPRDLVYVVGAERIGLRALDVTGVANPAAGIVDVSGAVTPPPSDELHAVFADPDAPAANDYLYVVGNNTIHVVDRPSVEGTLVSQYASAGFGRGPAGDSLFMLDPHTTAADRELWTLASQNASYIFRVTDFTQGGGAPLEAPQPDEAFYFAGPADGGVAVLGWDTCYLPTFGGVVRWDISDPTGPPHSNPYAGSYQPASYAGVDYLTEHLEIANLGTGKNDWQLLSPTAVGSFFAWPVDTTHDPLPGQAFTTPHGIQYWSMPGENWNAKPVYGNDIASWTHPSSGDKYILIDFAQDIAGPPAEHHLRLGRYNWSLQAWSPVIDCDDPSGVITGPARDVAVEGRWALVAANGGFVIVDLVTGLVTDWVYTNPINPGSTVPLTFENVMGVEKYGDRIFASLEALPVGGNPGNRFAFVMYSFDEVNGIVVDGTGLPSDAPIQYLLDGVDDGSGVVDDFPGVYMTGGERMSLIDVQSWPVKLRLYSGSGNGNLVEMEYDGTTDTMTALSYWNNGGYVGHVADCNVYKDYTAIPQGFGPVGPSTYSLRILVVKSMETFEIVTPPDYP